jgi:hypothetical protein
MNVQVLGASGRDKANLNLWRQSISFGHYTFIFGHRLSISNHAFVRSSTALVHAPTWTPKTLSNFVFRVSLAQTWENPADQRSWYFLISMNGNWWMCTCVLVSATRIASFINYKASTNQKVFSGVWDSSEHILLYRCKTNGTLAQKEQHINHHKPLVCLLLDMVSTPRNTTWWLVCFDASMQLLNMLLLVVTGRIVHWLGNYFERTI